jgi:hypothetical protein
MHLEEALCNEKIKGMQTSMLMCPPTGTTPDEGVNLVQAPNKDSESAMENFASISPTLVSVNYRG